MQSQFLIAAPSSGQGKTTIALGLMSLLRAKGYSVQPFKCGPDYIDTKFHEAVCGRPSVNLDTFMATTEHVQQLFRHYGQGADVCVVEGMMGLFDGYDCDRGSSAEVARVLGLPVVLVVDARSAAYSMTPLLKGFATFSPSVDIAGVIFNKVGSERHYLMLQQSAHDAGLACFGYLPKHVSLEQGSRYLGLDFSQQTPSEALTKLLEEHVDYQRLLRIGARSACPCPPVVLTPPATAQHVVVARNAESFSFIYQETIDSFGPDVAFFDPETEVPDLSHATLLYLPGGYPEKHLGALASAEATRSAIRAYAERGGRIAAECGGMMYLCRSIVDDDGEHPMCDVLPYTITARHDDRRLSLGYRRFVIDGHEYRGHEFHYTQFLGNGPQSVCQVFNGKGDPVGTPVVRHKNVLASYTHVARHLTFATPSPHERHPDHARLRPVMLAGTGSDVGKSVIAAAFCRIFMQDGYHPAPFKAQNMALNSFATPDGLEIGRAQAVQAEAAGIACHTDMNPLLLKPQSDHTSQVVLHGRPIGTRDAYDFWRKEDDGAESEEHREHIDFRAEVCAAFDRLAARHNPIVMEGAGSIAELNLHHRDLVNMPMARHADAAVILVADIDRGGVFASAYGSIMLQNADDRRRIKGIIINKFRGDMRLFDSGRRMLEDICGVPVLGVVPHFSDIHIEEEDSVSLAVKQRHARQAAVNVAVVMLRHLSNFTDFDALEQDARVHLYYTNNVDELQKADIIVLPGTKSTLDDLYELRHNGCAQAIAKAHRQGATVLGICGGYQMMGQEVSDPNHVEGDIERLPGLGLLPVSTTMSGKKITRQTTFTLKGYDKQNATLRGYEIHMGTTTPSGHAPQQPFALLNDGREDGYRASSRCMGTYLHGVLDNPEVVDMLLKPFAHRLDPEAKPFDYAAFKEEQYNRLADHVRRYVDMERVYQIMRNE